MSLGPTELILILLIVLLLFGAKRLPEIANSMGKSIKEFRKATDDAEKESNAEAEAGATNDEATS